MRGQRTLTHIFFIPIQKKRADVGATESCLSCFIRPSAPIREQYPNMHQRERLNNLFTTGRQVRLIRRGSKGTQALFATIISRMWTSMQPIEMWTSLKKFHQRAYLKPPFGATMKKMMQRSGRARTIKRKGSCFHSVSALGEIWHMTIFWSSGIPDSQSMTTMNLFLRTYL